MPEPRSLIGVAAITLAISAIACLVGVAPAQAATAPAAKNSWGSGGPFGLGIVLGEPSALTARYDLDTVRAIDGGIAFSFDRWTLVYVDGLYQFSGAFGRQNAFFAQTTPYLGIGGVLVISNLNDYDTRHSRYFTESSTSHAALGVRIPVGAEWRAATAPIGVFAELVPGMVIIPATTGFLELGIGARFYF